MRTAFPRGSGLKALLPLLAVFTVDIEADNADIQLVPAAVEQRARRRLARPVIVRPDADSGAVGLDIRIDDNDMDALVGRLVDQLGGRRVVCLLYTSRCV